MAAPADLRPEPRLRHEVRPARRARSLAALVLTAVLIAVLAATLASVVVWALAVAVHHASSG